MSGTPGILSGALAGAFANGYDWPEIAGVAREFIAAEMEAQRWMAEGALDARYEDESSSADDVLVAELRVSAYKFAAARIREGGKT